MTIYISYDIADFVSILSYNFLLAIIIKYLYVPVFGMIIFYPLFIGIFLVTALQAIMFVRKRVDEEW